MSGKIHIFLLDNVDSFTYNLVDELRGLGHTLTIYRNTVPATHIIDAMQTASQTSDVMLMLSPGPGTPSAAGCMPELLSAVAGQFPVLGICLGHQAIVEHFGGKVVRAGAVMHGKSSNIQHDDSDIFTGLPNPLPVARYHSLMASDMPSELDVIASVDETTMAVHHRQQNMIGFQFHPESLLTAQGSQLLKQSVDFLVSNSAQKDK